MTDLPSVVDELFKLPTPSAEGNERLRAAKRLKEYATFTVPVAAPQATDHVKSRLRPLHRVLWQGQQWAVTTYGIEARDGSYWIEKHRLWENEEHYGWVRHMAGKTWVHLPDFAEALRVARKLHQEGPKPRTLPDVEAHL